MFNRKWVLGGLLCLSLVWAGPPSWVIVNTPATDTFNGISAPHSEFAIAVGNNGTIVHFIDGDNGTVMTSGTNNDLFDVYASSVNLAVATGEDVVLLWDGVTWSTLRTENEGTIFTGTWISPEEDVILYGILDSSFSFVCPEIPGDPVPSFCRTFGRPMLTACGISEDIKLFTTDGDIYHVNNFLGDAYGTNPIHDEALPLSLDGVWVPAGSCLPGTIAPLEAFAIRNHVMGELWHFDGSTWTNMNVNVPADQTLTWIGGADPDDVIAVGFEPDGVGGNQGVVWHYDGSTWTEDVNLPPGTPGLTDVTVTVSPPISIFHSGFESSVNPIEENDLAGVDSEVTAESGLLIINGILDANRSDVKVEKSRLTNGPYRNGDHITYQIVVQNIGAVTATNLEIWERFVDILEYVSDTCNLEMTPTLPVFTYYKKQVASLAPSEVFICDVVLQVNGQVGQEIENLVEVRTNDYNYANNKVVLGGVFIEAP